MVATPTLGVPADNIDLPGCQTNPFVPNHALLMSRPDLAAHPPTCSARASGAALETSRVLLLQCRSSHAHNAPCPTNVVPLSMPSMNTSRPFLRPAPGIHIYRVPFAITCADMHGVAASTICTCFAIGHTALAFNTKQADVVALRVQHFPYNNCLSYGAFADSGRSFDG